MNSKQKKTNSKSKKASSKTNEVKTSPKPKPKTNHKNEKIGEILKRVREHRNEDLRTVSEYLCIRRAYLYAMEESLYDDLPAEAYVIGFLRSYAGYLGLDGQGAVDQYRREMAGSRHLPNLSMPQPMTEGRAPTIALLAGATIAAIIIYGLWYGLSTPEDLVNKESISIPETSSEISTENTSLEMKSSESEENKKNATNNLLKETTSSGITLSVTGQDETALPPEAAKKMDFLVITATNENTKKPKKEELKTFGAKNKSQVTIEATKKAWILITNKKGLTVFDRTLKKGQKYNVRNNKDLRLTTGNADALLFIVNGKTLPKLKAGKNVVRAISLNPNKLKKRLR